MSFSSEINSKLWLLLLLLPAYFAMEGYRVRQRLAPKKLRWWLAFRLLAIFCLLPVLAGAGIVLSPGDTTTIFLVDVSLSVRDSQSAMEQYLNNQLSLQSHKDKAAVITFGQKPMLEVPVSREIREVRLAAQPNPYFTDLEKAVDFALDYFPKDSNRRLVLISDGKENTGNVASLAGKLRDNNVSLLIYFLEGEQQQDVQLSSLALPDNIHPGEQVPVKVSLDSTMKTRGTFHLFAGGKQVLQKEVTLEPGTNNLEFPFALEEQGRMDYRGEISFPGDANARNNSLTTTVEVENLPQILVVGADNDAKTVNNLLSSLGISYRHYLPGRVPATKEFLSRFAEVFLVNVAHTDLPSDFEANLADCVQELATGLVCIGGDRSFALGGYEHTLLEKMLPVQCRMKGNKKQPNLGLVLAIDCSGSMEDASAGVKKIEMAKEAALRSVEVLEPGDYLGVLAFADTLEWVVPFGPLQDKETVKKSIGRLAPRGGTLIIPALNETVTDLKQAPAKIKHVILLTDGQGEQEGYQIYAEAMKENKITLSTVAVGQDADRRVLESLADYTGGRKYFARDLHSVPQIFTRETYLAARRYLNNEEFTPVQVQKAACFPSVPLPPLKGYVGTGIKDKADLILKSHLDDPVLAAWQYGLGKVVVWTSDLNGQWSAPWLAWGGFQQQWSSLINWCLPNRFGDQLQVQLTRKGGEVEVYAATLSPQSGQRAEMLVQGPVEQSQEALLQQVAPGKYSGKFSLDQVGDYVATVRLRNQDELTDSLIKTVHLDYSPEYALDTRNGKDCLKDLVGLTGGKLINEKINVFQQQVIKNPATVKLDFILLPLALLFFILDIAVRRLDWF